MLIGEVPGDQEDLQGKPFVGPAGKLLDKALVEAGIPAGSVYLTNAVKHYKWEPRGKKRLHAKPSAEKLQLAARGWKRKSKWSDPRTIVCLGATAAQTLLGRTFRLTKHFGRPMPSAFGPRIFATYHPSAILRAPDHDRARTNDQAIDSSPPPGRKIVHLKRKQVLPMPLREYQAKRNFSRTSEPRGDRKKPAAPNALSSIQKHAATRLHYDFRLEHNGVMLSWAVPKGPSFDPRERRLAVQVEDHPLEYNKFEGTIPKGEYGGGTVMIWDYGTWQPQESGSDRSRPPRRKTQIHPQRTRNSTAAGRSSACKTRGSAINKSNWLLIKERDRFARSSSGR